MASKYRKYERKEIPRKEIHPVWRGIGCNIIVLVPVISYFIMVLVRPAVINTGQVPPEIMGRVTFPTWVGIVPILNNIAGYLGSIDQFWLKVILFVVILMLLATVSSLIWSVVYSAIGPARYTEMDAPEMERKAKAYKR